MRGLFVGIAAFLTLLVSGLWSKATKSLKQKNENLEKEKQLSQAVTPIAVNSAVKKTEIEDAYEETMREIDKAGKNNDVDWLKRIASEMAQKALSMGAKEKKK